MIGSMIPHQSSWHFASYLSTRIFEIGSKLLLARLAHVKRGLEAINVLDFGQHLRLIDAKLT